MKCLSIRITRDALLYIVHRQKFQFKKNQQTRLPDHNSCSYTNHKYSLYKSPINTAIFQDISRKDDPPKDSVLHWHLFIQSSLTRVWMYSYFTQCITLKTLYLVSLDMYHIHYSTNLQQTDWFCTSPWGFLRNIMSYIFTKLFQKRKIKYPTGTIFKISSSVTPNILYTTSDKITIP